MPVIYCDRLTLGACVQAMRCRAMNPSGGLRDIRILDSAPNRGWQRVLMTLMSFVGFRIEEAQFVAGHLHTAASESVYIAARRAANEIAIQSAKNIVEHSRFLNRLNFKWGRNTILLYLAKAIRMPAEQVILRLLVAEALAREAGESHTQLILHRPIEFDPNLIRDLCPVVQIYFYRTKGGLLKVIPFTTLGRRVLKQLSTLKSRLGRWKTVRAVNQEIVSTEPPSLLILQEDDISLDRSHRTQPHWLLPGLGRPAFRTLILQESSVNRLPVDDKAIAEHGVVFIKESEIATLKPPRSDDQLHHRLSADFRTCIFHVLFNRSTEIICAVLWVGHLIRRAKRLLVFCKQKNVQAFMTCENYMTDAHAIQLIAPKLGINTLSYQYSNLVYPSLGMLTTADTMLTFSDHYHGCFARPGIQPGSFKNIGYVFDSSFQFVRERAKTHRRQLFENGARFVICYFDESVQFDKYGIIQASDHQAEILELLEKVLADATLGLILKVQFQRNSPQKQPELGGAVAAAKATGRFVELIHGLNRNIVFPAEASLAADVAIGHAVGATASLEAALVGTRSIIINLYGIKSTNDALYAQCDIVYPSLSKALQAIDRLRKGAPEFANLGNWSKILNHFDPFQDGQAGLRMLRILEEAVVSASSGNGN